MINVEVFCPFPAINYTIMGTKIEENNFYNQYHSFIA